MMDSEFYSSADKFSFNIDFWGNNGKKVELDFGSLSLNGMLTSQCRSSRHTFACTRNFLILLNDPIRSQNKIHFFRP